jgi:hypothetical protein
MVLIVLANAWKINHALHTRSLQNSLVPDATKFKYMRRLHRTCRDYHILPHGRSIGSAIGDVCDSGGSIIASRIRSRRKVDLSDLCVREKV